jgi:hypothetical protein
VRAVFSGQRNRPVDAPQLTSRNPGPAAAATWARVRVRRGRPDRRCRPEPLGRDATWSLGACSCSGRRGRPLPSGERAERHRSRTSTPTTARAGGRHEGARSRGGQVARLTPSGPRLPQRR